MSAERDAVAEVLAAVLYDHREGALTCYDHPPTPEHPAWCCVCGEHQLMVSWRSHVAAHLSDALAGVIAAKQAKALREAAGECPFLDPEVADEVIDWLRSRAEAIENG